MKTGDKVLVDVGHTNGGYEAEIIWIGKYFARIRAGEYEWDIMANRLTPPVINKSNESNR